MTRGVNLLEDAVEKTDERSHQTRDEVIKRIIEALLFSSSEAIPLQKIREIINSQYPLRTRELERLIRELSEDYKRQGHAFQIDHLAGGVLLRTIAEMGPFVEQLHQDRRMEKLSRAATEVLAIIAYRAPITRREIESLRGVDSSGTVQALLERELIEPVGRKEAPGRPVQFGITRRFLQHFGLKNLQDLKS